MKTYTINQAAAELGIAPSTVRSHIDNKNITAQRDEQFNRIVITAAELERYQQNRRPPGVPEYARKGRRKISKTN